MRIGKKKGSEYSRLEMVNDAVGSLQRPDEKAPYFDVNNGMESGDGGVGANHAARQLALMAESLVIGLEGHPLVVAAPGLVLAILFSPED